LASTGITLHQLPSPNRFEFYDDIDPFDFPTSGMLRKSCHHEIAETNVVEVYPRKAFHNPGAHSHDAFDAGNSLVFQLQDRMFGR